MRLFLGLLLISFNVFATNWTDLEQGTHYKITQSFSLPQTERSHANLEFMKGQAVILKEIAPLEAVQVTLFVFDYKNCPGPAMTTEMETIPVQATSPVIEIGAQLEKNCELNVYIENKDLMSKSIFQ